ncbi:MAG: sugar transferase, partial [Flavobacteriaceae bacterium]|nr:sugar transferase [Flavobacteriaceae bacterium]
NEKSLSAIHDISRLTNWGRFLRRTSIDELPALFHVMKGDMSLVGPRPLPLKYLNRFDDYQIKRIEVKPGITGLAQINGRNHLSWEKRFEYDVQYTNNNSFLIDLNIIIKTILLVIRGKNIHAKRQEIMPEFMGSKKKSNK